MPNLERSVADGMRASTDASTVQNAVHTCQDSRSVCTASTGCLSQDLDELVQCRCCRQYSLKMADDHVSYQRRTALSSRLMYTPSCALEVSWLCSKNRVAPPRMPVWPVGPVMT